MKSLPFYSISKAAPPVPTPPNVLLLLLLLLFFSQNYPSLRILSSRRHEFAKFSPIFPINHPPCIPPNRQHKVMHYDEYLSKLLRNFSIKLKPLWNLQIAFANQTNDKYTCLFFLRFCIQVPIYATSLKVMDLLRLVISASMLMKLEKSHLE